MPNSEQRPTGSRERLSVMYTPPDLPEHLPPAVYGILLVDSKYVVTVDDIPTSAPRWENPEEARRDAWERHWADERGAAAIAAYRAENPNSKV